MKCLKKLVVLLLFITHCVHPKSIQRPSAPTKPAQPIQQPIIKPVVQQPPIIPQQPAIQLTNYAQALNTIRTMPTEKIMRNNVLTNEFINFVTSLKLSNAETKALLEAGAYSRASWTGNDEIDKQIIASLKNNIAALLQSPSFAKATEGKQKPQEKQAAQPIKKSSTPKKEVSTSKVISYPAVYNLIMLLDPERVEKLESDSRAMVQDALMGLYEQVAPIIMTSNILEIITTIRQKIGEKDLQRLRNSSYGQTQPLAQELVNTYKLPESYLNIIMMSLINFDSATFNCYLHPSAPLVLIIPQQYIQANIPNGANLTPQDKIRACGFNPNGLTKIDNLAPENLLQQLKKQQAQVNRAQFIGQLMSLFAPQKKYGELISPMQDSKWAIYMSGHGGPAYQSIGNVRQIIPQIARVAGLTMQEFAQLMTFFDDTIDVAYLHYTTCFSGGYNQTFVNHVLSSLDVNFIVSSEGVGERKVTGIPLHIWFNSQKPYIRPDRPFTKFFELLKLFIGNPEQFVKIKEAKKDPVAQILLAIHPPQYITEANQPFVRFPGAEVFGALALNKNVKVLTQTIVKAHEIERKPIDLSNVDIIIVNPSRINVPLNLGKLNKGEHRAIVSPTAKTIEQYRESIHVFKEIDCQTTLPTLLFNFVYLNTSMNTQTFVVKELKGVNQTIHDLIIQINKQIIHSGIGEMTANVHVAFEQNNTIYQGTIAIQGFSNTQAIYQACENARWIAQPTQATNMNTVAAQFLTPQEINQLKKPITLDTIAQFIDAKIDIQQPSLKETEVKKELTEFVKQMPKKQRVKK